MGDYVFKSKYSIEEIERNFKDADFFNGIRKGLEEALAYEKGKASAQTIARKRSLPDVDVKAERESLDMTQKAFANVLGVSKNCRSMGNRTKYTLSYSKESDLSYISETRSCTYVAGSAA